MQDRIKQMAVEAGFDRFNDESVDPINFEPSPDGMWLLWDEDALARFARLVAEDCAAHVERKMTEGRSPMGKVAADAIRARYAETKAQSPD